MKKSFKTRVLSLGLSIVMAFSLVAVGGVNTTSAAKKPAMITKDGESARELQMYPNQTLQIKADTWTKKNFKITSAKASSKNVIVRKNKAGTLVTIVNNIEKVGDKTDYYYPCFETNVTITFKNKKTGKICKSKYVSSVSGCRWPVLVDSATGGRGTEMFVNVGDTCKIKSNAATLRNYDIVNAETDSDAITVRAVREYYDTVYEDYVEIVGVTPTQEDKPVTVEVTFRHRATGEICTEKFVCKVTVL